VHKLQLATLFITFCCGYQWDARRLLPESYRLTDPLDIPRTLVEDGWFTGWVW